MKPKGNPTPHNNSPNTVPNLPADPDSDPSFPYSSLLYSSDSSENEYYKQKRCAKNNKINARVKCVLMTLLKSAQILHPSYLQPCKNQR